MKKKVVYTLSIIAVLAILSLCFISVYLLSSANKDFTVTAEGLKTSYYSANLTFFASDEDVFSVEAEAQHNVTTLFSIGCKDNVSLQFESNPLKLYYRNMISDGELTEVKVNMVTGTYDFCPIYDGDIDEEFWTTVIADYGIQKRIICFGFFNSSVDYVENADDYKKSTLDDNSFSSSVSFDSFNINYPIYSTEYNFTFTNFEGNDIVTDGFIIEKNVNGIWCVAGEKMDTPAAQKLPDQLKLRGVTLKTGQSRSVNLNLPLYLLFDETEKNHVLSGDYRIVLKYTVDGKTKYAASSRFSLGYNPDITVK